MKPRSEAGVGILYGASAFFLWGLMPAYWRLVRHVTALELLSHRVIWSLVFLLGVVAWRGRLPELGAAFRARRTARTLFITASLIGLNWLVFIWAVNNGHVLQSSLGYFINPLGSVLLGWLLLKETLLPLQKGAIAFAGAGVLILVLGTGGVPWIALVLAGTFATYGLLRKTAAVDALIGLTVESVLMAPLALGYLIYLEATHQAAFMQGAWTTDVLLVATGLLTALPLLWFAHAARRLTLGTLGMLQYLSPTCQFLLAVLAYGEAFTVVHQVSFVLIWAGVGLYSVQAGLTIKAQGIARQAEK